MAQHQYRISGSWQRNMWNRMGDGYTALQSSQPPPFENPPFRSNPANRRPGMLQFAAGTIAMT